MAHPSQQHCISPCCSSTPAHLSTAQLSCVMPLLAVAATAEHFRRRRFFRRQRGRVAAPFNAAIRSPNRAAAVSTESRASRAAAVAAAAAVETGAVAVAVASAPGAVAVAALVLVTLLSQGEKGLLLGLVSSVAALVAARVRTVRSVVCVLGSGSEVASGSELGSGSRS